VIESTSTRLADLYMRGITQAFIDAVSLAALAKLSLVNQSLAVAVDDTPETGQFGVAGDVDATFPARVGERSHACIAEIQRFVHIGIRGGHLGELPMLRRVRTAIAR